MEQPERGELASDPGAFNLPADQQYIGVLARVGEKRGEPMHSSRVTKESPAPPMARRDRARIVFAVVKRAHFPEMYRTACGMLRSGKFVPVILFTGDEDFDFSDELALCEAAGLDFIVDSDAEKFGHIVKNKSTAGPAGSETGEALFVSAAPSGIRHRLKHLPVLGPVLKKVRDVYTRCVVTKTAFICLPWHLSRLRRLRQSAKNILQRAQSDVVVVPHIETGRLLGCIAIEAKALGTPVVVIPYTWIFREEIMKVYIGKPEYQTSRLINRWVSRKYPQWLYKGYLFLPPVYIVALGWLGLPTANPWMEDDTADVIALESEVMLRSYVADGVAASKCRVTGSASHDILALVRSTAGASDSTAARGTGRQDDKSQFVLSFLPPDQTPNQMAGFEFASYWNMLLFWIATVTADDAIPAIFSLHPRMRNLKGSLLARFPKLRIYDGDACELIPHAKFCVGQFGGMMRYAIACAKPVLYYDVFDYRISGDEFTSVSSVITVNRRAAFAATYARFATDTAYFASLEKNARANASDWGKLDGRAVERIEALIASECLRSYSS